MPQYQTVNPALLGLVEEKLARLEKRSFVPQGDPAMSAGDPVAGGGGGGGAPPMGGDPMAGGGAPPVDPMAGGGGGDPMAALMPMIQQAVQQAMAANGGGAGGGGAGAGGGLKPKIDINIEIMQMKKLLARIVDSLGIPVPAQEMVATEQDLNAMAQGGGQPGAAAGAGSGQSAIPPIQPMQAAAPGMGGPPKMASVRATGHGFSQAAIATAGNKARAILALQGRA